MLTPVKEQDPQADKDWHMDWSDWLVAGDTLTVSSWAITEGDATELTLYGSMNTNTVATVWVKDGVEGSRYRLTNSIETAQGRKDDRSFYLWIREG